MRPGGRILLTGFGVTAFQPLAQLYCDQLAALGGPQLSVEDFPWQRLADTKILHRLLQEAGLEAIELANQQLGYHLQTPQEWWEILWNTGFRAPLQALDGAQLEEFHQQHLQQVAAQFKDGTCWLDIPVLFASARVAE